MNETAARIIFGLEGIRVEANNALYCLSNYVYWHPEKPKATLDGTFSPQVLEALVWWMQNKAVKS